jgi:MOSC domain-containing protein YiiM
MWSGTVVSIYISPGAEDRMISVESARAIPGKGLEGDRYCLETGTYSSDPSPHRQVTLIEDEALEALARDYEIELEPGASRRNIVTQGVPLNHLVGSEFHVGDVLLRGTKLCEPCHHLEKVVGRAVRPGLVHRGGLRAEILSGGIIRPGDSIRLR